MQSIQKFITYINTKPDLIEKIMDKNNNDKSINLIIQCIFTLEKIKNIKQIINQINTKRIINKFNIQIKNYIQNNKTQNENNTFFGSNISGGTRRRKNKTKNRKLKHKKRKTYHKKKVLAR